MDRCLRSACLPALGRILLACAWLIGCCSPALASEAVSLRVSLMTTQEDALAPERIVSGSYDRQFLPAVDGEALRLKGGGSFVHWLRFEVELPPVAQGPSGSQWVLLLNRTMLDRLTLYLPASDGVRPVVEESFFAPRSGDSALASHFAFPLVHDLEGTAVIYASIRSRAVVSLDAQLVERQDYQVLDRRIGMLLIAVYTALLVLMLNALALYLALHDRAYLHFVGLSGSVTLFLAALNGHLYGLPLLSVAGWWGGLGVFLLAFLSSAFLVRFSQAFIGREALGERLDRGLTGLWYVLLAAAALCLLKIQAMVSAIQTLGTLTTGLTALLVVGVSVHAARGGSRPGRWLAALVALLAITLWMRIGADAGWIAPGYAAQFGFQVMAAVSAFLLSIGLAERVFAFRQEHEEAREQVERADVTLQSEQNRRQFVEGLRESLRTCPAGDMVWVTARRLLAAVRQQLPTESAGIIAVGYRGFDLMLGDPGEAKERYTRLMAARGSTLRGICRSRTPVQAAFDEAAGDNPEAAVAGGKFAVVPLQVARPGWGALLLERAAWEEFTQAELKMVQELCDVAERALDDAIGQAELRKRAEIDPLTGIYNRRAFDAMIGQLFERAMSARQPISLLFLDLDLFKQINDKHGHATGDDCLRAVCEAARRELDAKDVLARYGGEEFVVVLPGQTADQARQVAERIRSGVAQLRVQSEKGVVKMTISIGLAARGAEDEEPQTMIARADKALYVAKRNGRNQVQVAQVYGQGAGAPPPEGPLGF